MNSTLHTLYCDWLNAYYCLSCHIYFSDLINHSNICFGSQDASRRSASEQLDSRTSRLANVWTALHHELVTILFYLSGEKGYLLISIP